jgi:hypothetical protein
VLPPPWTTNNTSGCSRLYSDVRSCSTLRMAVEPAMVIVVGGGVATDALSHAANSAMLAARHNHTISWIRTPWVAKSITAFAMWL